MLGEDLAGVAVRCHTGGRQGPVVRLEGFGGVALPLPQVAQVTPVEGHLVGRAELAQLPGGGLEILRGLLVVAAHQLDLGERAARADRLDAGLGAGQPQGPVREGTRPFRRGTRRGPKHPDMRSAPDPIRTGAPRDAIPLERSSTSRLRDFMRAEVYPQPL